MQRRRLNWTSDVRGVSDVIGNMLLVAMTAVLTVSLVFMVQNIPAGKDSIHVSLVATIGPGSDGTWGNGNEELRLEHGWGEPVAREGTQVILTLGGVPTTFSGAALDGEFSDGALSVGETWVKVLNVPRDLEAVIQIVTDGDGGQLLSSVVTRTGELLPGVCDDDASPPSINAWLQTPSDVTTSHTGVVSIDASAIDACAGVNDGVTPRLYWALSVGTPASYTDGGAMTLAGNARWVGELPAHTWSAEIGKTLYYYVGGIEDFNGNSGNSATQQDLVETFTTKTYITSATASIGTIIDLDAAKDASDGGAEALLREHGDITGSATNDEVLIGSSVASSNVLGPNNIFASDNVRAAFKGPASNVRVSGWDVPSTATGISAVHIGFEAKSTDASIQIADLAYKVDAEPLGVTKLTQSVTASFDQTFSIEITADRAWTIADVESMAVHLDQTSGNGKFDVDQVYVEVFYTVASTTYALNVTGSIDSVPAGNSVALALKYRGNLDTFDVQVYDWVALSWTTKAPQLTSTTSTRWTTPLANSELSLSGSGQVQMRILDATPLGTDKGEIYFDYIRAETSP